MGEGAINDMDIGSAQIASAIWLGILTSISPCPLATNIAATTFIGKQIDSRYGTIFAALSYTFGRALSYMLISVLIVAGLISIPGVSNFLQRHMNQILGPVLILTGVFVLEWVRLPTPTFNLNVNFANKLADKGIAGGAALGFLFALSFCPVSAALFFGSVIPLSLKYESRLLLPLCYGLGTAAPVILISFIIAYSSRFAGIFFNKVGFVEDLLRRMTGGFFILIGIYFCLKYSFRLLD
jgi:cytochrome c biogenesis protein CcdA